MASSPPTEFLYDGFGSVLGGMNGAVAPSLVPDGMCANAINAVFRGGKPTSRPAFLSQNLTFSPVYASDGTTITLTAGAVQSAFNGGLFQGAGFYRYQDNAWFFAAVAGRIYRLTPQQAGLTAQPPGFLVEDFTPDAGNSPTRELAYFCQCGKFLAIQDGQSAPILIKGSQVTRSNLAKNQMPIGTIMAYGYGRTVVCTGGGNYEISDLQGEVPDAEVSFIDDTYLAENADYSLPPNFGNVVAIIFLDQQDTATGVGQCLIFGDNGVESLNIASNRSTWQTTQIQLEVLTQIGGTGHRNVISINGDVWFRSADGWRSFRQARAEQSGTNKVPQSTRVRPYTDIEMPEQLRYGSGISFNNRLIMTCNPQRSNGGVAHTGLLSLDFDVITNGLNGSYVAPAWDGYWNGIPTAQLIVGMFNGRKRAFAFTTAISFNADGSAVIANGLSEIVEGAAQDIIGYNAGTGAPITAAITSALETRAFNCAPAVGANAPWLEKRLEFCDLFEQKRTGATDIKVEYRSDGKQAYLPLAEFVEDAPQAVTLLGVSLLFAGPQYTVRNRSFTPPDTSTGSDTRLDRRFYELQARITWTGQVFLHRFRVAATAVAESRRAGN